MGGILYIIYASCSCAVILFLFLFLFFNQSIVMYRFKTGILVTYTGIIYQSFSILSQTTSPHSLPSSPFSEAIMTFFPSLTRSPSLPPQHNRLLPFPSPSPFPFPFHFPLPPYNNTNLTSLLPLPSPRLFNFIDCPSENWHKQHFKIQIQSQLQSQPLNTLTAGVSYVRSEITHSYGLKKGVVR